MTDGFINAPWSGEQVDALNRYQRAGDVHEFTCPTNHDGADRTLYATVNGWCCPHCDYKQDWAHEMMLTHRAMESRVIIPCDVLLPPNTIIRKGCDLGTLMAAFKARATRSPSENRFAKPGVPRPENWIEGG